MICDSAASEISSDAAPMMSATPASSTGSTSARSRLRNDSPAFASSPSSSTSTGCGWAQSLSSPTACLVDGASKALASKTASEPRSAWTERALRSALSVHADRGSLAVFDASAFDAPSTRQAVGLLKDWAQPQPVLVLLDGDEANAGLSFRNLERALVLPVEDAGVADIIGAASLLISEAALSQITARANGAGVEQEEAA